MKTEKLDFWIKNNYNVLIRGSHGTGKTTIVKEAFERNGLNWLYFSASTMDPWVDFIGIPKETVDDQGNKFLDLVRPRPFANDEVEALFFDELNRANKKVRNAVMELIQFKSINGKKFNNLKVVWAAINPESEDENDETYDVEKLDPAQLDRFHIIIDADDKPNRTYFKKKYAENGTVAVDWWNALPKEAKANISPRRLDYILDIFNNNGDIDDALPKSVSSVQLIAQLKNGSYISQLKTLMDDNNMEAISAKMKDMNFLSSTINHIIDKDYISKLSPYIPKEDMVNLILTNQKIRSKLLSDKEFVESNVETLKEIKNTKGIPNKISKELNKVIPKTITNKNSNTGSFGLEELLNLYWSDNPKITPAQMYYYNNTYKRNKIVVDVNLVLDNVLKTVETASTMHDIMKIISVDDIIKIMSIISSVRVRTHGDSMNKPVVDAFTKLHTIIGKCNFDSTYIYDTAISKKLYLKNVNGNSCTMKLKKNLESISWF